jgi:D-inositol-3-phosphate glycosyltransferase
MNVYLRSVAGWLAHDGWKVDIYTRATGPQDIKQPQRDIGLAKVHYLKAGPARPLGKADLTAVTEEFAQAMANFPPASVIHSHYWLSGLAGLTVAAVWGAPHVQSLHTVATMKNRDLAAGDTPENATRISAEKRLARQADAVVAVSRAERAAIVADYGVDPAAVRVISPGVDPAVFHPGPPPDPASLPQALRRPTGYLLMAGRIQPIKGQDLALQALARIPRPVRPALLITGAPGQGHLEYAAMLRSLAGELGLLDDAVFFGPQDPPRLAALMRGARATLLPSRSETFGLVAIESAACGRPVIGSDTTGLRDSVTDGVTGRLIASRDPQTWADGIVQTLGDERLDGAGGGPARTWRQVAQALSGLYLRLARHEAAR